MDFLPNICRKLTKFHFGKIRPCRNFFTAQYQFVSKNKSIKFFIIDQNKLWHTAFLSILARVSNGIVYTVNTGVPQKKRPLLTFYWNTGMNGETVEICIGTVQIKKKSTFLATVAAKRGLGSTPTVICSWGNIRYDLKRVKKAL